MLKLFALPLMAAGLMWGTSFSECPAVGADTSGCELLITVTSVGPLGVATAFTVTDSSPDQGPFDGSDDTLIGVLNSSGATLTAIGLLGPSGEDIFGFDGDGACSGYTPGPTATQCGSALQNPTGYGSAGASFALINPITQNSGVVLLTGGLANGSSTWFSLEEALTATDLTSSGTPEAGTFLMLSSGLIGLGLLKRRQA
jgi:hypothetical protein